MKKIKSREEFMKESFGNSFDQMNEDEMVRIDITVEDKPDTVVKSIENIDGVKIDKVLPFGVIKATTKKGTVSSIRKVNGVEDVEVLEEKND